VCYGLKLGLLICRKKNTIYTSFLFSSRSTMFLLESFMCFSLEAGAKALGWFGILQSWFVLVELLFNVEFINCLMTMASGNFPKLFRQLQSFHEIAIIGLYIGCVHSCCLFAVSILLIRAVAKVNFIYMFFFQIKLLNLFVSCTEKFIANYSMVVVLFNKHGYVVCQYVRW
jgi:hypothetical protein